jgi:hypothetical protein
VETIEHDANMTKHPIELGADISDHVILEPVTYVFQGVVSDHPLKWNTTAYQQFAKETRHLSAYSILRTLHRTREPFTMSHGFLETENAVLLGFRSEKDPAKANVFQFEARIQEAIIVESEEVSITEEMVAAGDQGEGARPPADAGPQTGEPVGTLLSSILEWGSSVLGGGP